MQMQWWVSKVNQYNMNPLVLLNLVTILNGYHSTKVTTEEQTKLSKHGDCVLFFLPWLNMASTLETNIQKKKKKNKP
jgi:hypothetical protein